MTRYLALLRAINLGSRNKIAMPELKALFVDHGYGDVRTHLQTGNVIFTADRVTPGELEKHIAADLGLDITVLLRTEPELAKVVTSNPFADGPADPAKLYVTFLDKAPADGRIDRLDELADESEEYAAVRREVYLHCPNGYGRSKLSNVNLEKRLEVAATTRSWKVVSTLHRMIGE